jgi:hypothetical protein
MQASYRPITLQPGQALAIDRHAAARLLVTAGEVLVQAPAQWLGETVVFSPPRRIAGPAALDCAGIQSVTAIGAVKIHLAQAPSPLERLRAGWRQVRTAWPRALRLSQE